jgi:hypothetical protein
MKKQYFAASVLFHLSNGKEGGYHITSLFMKNLQQRIEKLKNDPLFSRAVIHTEKYTAEEARYLRLSDAES